jgi:hypothetical protein
MSAESKLITAPDDIVVPRRAFLKQSTLLSLGIAAAAGLAGSPAVAAVSKSTEDDIVILNAALALEYQGIAAYQIGADSGLLEKGVRTVAVKFQSQHRAHAGVLAAAVTKLGGKPVAAKKPDQYGFPVAKLKSQNDVLAFAAGLEKGAASAYLGAVPTLHNRDLAKAAASILGDETMHWAVLLNALGKDPVPVAFIS